MFSWPLISERGQIICYKCGFGFYSSIYLWPFYASFYSTLAMHALACLVKWRTLWSMGLGGGLIGRSPVWRDEFKKKKKLWRPNQTTKGGKRSGSSLTLISLWEVVLMQNIIHAQIMFRSAARWSGKNVPSSSKWKMNSVSEHDKPHNSVCLL